MGDLPGSMSTTQATGLYFEDVQSVMSCDTPGVQVPEDEIIRFAQEWDPQPFHIDRQAARASVFGDLCASGLQTLLFTYRSLTRLKLFEGTTLSGLGMDQLKFHAPVFVGDMLYVRVTVEDAIPTGKLDRGVLKLLLSTRNQSGTLLSDLLLPVLVKRRAAAQKEGEVPVHAV